MRQAFFIIILSALTLTLSNADLKTRNNLRERKLNTKTSPPPPTEMSIPNRKENPTDSLKATQSSTVDKASLLPESITVDDKLQIFFPKPKSEEDFFFQPYSQDFMNLNVRFLQISLPEIEKLLAKLAYQDNSFNRNLDFIIKFSHYRHLLEYHKIFQLSAKNLEIIDSFNERFIFEFLLEIQKNPAAKLREFKEILLRKYQFNDIYALNKLYDKILYHINKTTENKEDYEWCKTQMINWGNSDAAWIYMNYLDRQPEEIFKSAQYKLQELLYEKITALIQIPSRTYLHHARKLYQGLRIMNSDPVMIENLALRLEFAALQFQSYEENSIYYDEMMKLFPNLPGAKEYFVNEREKALIFLPFFDQLTEYAEKRFQRGKFACQDSIPVNEEQCSLHWREASRFFSFIVEQSPFSTLTIEGLEKLKIINSSNRSKTEFISKTRLFELADYLNKPQL